jgi:hypothetical protein
MTTDRALAMSPSTRRARRTGGGRAALALVPLLASLAGPAAADYGAPERLYLRWAGGIASVSGGGNTFVFAGPTVTVTVPAGQTRVVRGSATAALGLAAPGPQRVLIGLCYQSTGGGAINTFGLASQIFQDMDAVRRQYAINDSVKLPGGSYNIGYCVNMNLKPIAITNTDKSIGYLVVTPD